MVLRNSSVVGGFSLSNTEVYENKDVLRGECRSVSAAVLFVVASSEGFL